MDTEALIAAVYQRSAIWDRREKLHRNRNVVDKYWKEIGAEMKQEEFKLRKRWKYLRDQFAVELRKVPPPCFGDSGDNSRSKWQYYYLLMFLKDVVKPRPSSGNFSRVTMEELPETLNETQLSAETQENVEDTAEYPPTPPLQEAVAEENTGSAPRSSTHEYQISARRGRKRKNLVDNFNDSMLRIESQKLRYLQEKLNRKKEKESPDDEHLNFFKSLIPHIRKIPESRILSFRSRVQELVQQFANYEQSLSSPIITQSFPST